MAEIKKVKIGKIVNAAGLKGEVKIYSYASSKERYETLESIYVENSRHVIESVRYLKETVIAKLAGINDRSAAEAAKGKDVYMDEADLPKLPPGEYFVRDMIGLFVEDGGGGHIGTLSDVIQGSAHDLYEVTLADGRKVLIPAVGEFILNIDMEKKRIDVKLIEGLI